MGLRGTKLYIGFGKTIYKILVILIAVLMIACNRGREFEQAAAAQVEVRAVRNTNAATKLQKLPIYFPVGKKGFKRISSRFGMRHHPTLKKQRFHAGLDLAAALGTPIYAAADGVILSSNYSKTYGNYVIMRHGRKYKTIYGHMSKRAVKKYQSVRQGDIIGYVGSTGRSTGPHLHFEILEHNRTIDPLKYWMGILQEQTLVTL